MSVADATSSSSESPTPKARPSRHPVVRWLKAIAIMVATLIVFVVAAFYIALHLIDFNKYQPLIANELQQKFGIEAEFNGDIRAQKWPFAMQAEQLTLQGEWQDYWWQADIESVTIKLSLGDLVRQQQANPVGINWQVSGLRWGVLGQEQSIAEITQWQGSAGISQQHNQAWLVEMQFYLASKLQQMQINPLVYDLDAQTLSWRELIWQQDHQAENVMTAQAAFSWQSEFHWDLSAQLINFNPRELTEVFGAHWPNFVAADAFTQVSGEVATQGSAQDWSLAMSPLTLDQTQIRGQIAFKDQIHLQVGLDIDQLSMDFYRAHSTLREGETYLPIAVPVTTLRQTPLQGELNLAQLTLWGADYHAIYASLQGEAGVVNLNPLRLDLYQGYWAGDMQIDVTGETPAFALKWRWQDVALGDWLSAMVDYKDLSGKLGGEGRLQTAGSNEQALKYNAQGEFELQLFDGTYRGLDLNRLLMAQIPQAGDTTVFEQLTVSGRIVDGVMTVRPVKLASTNFDISGRAQVHLPTSLMRGQLVLDYRKPPTPLGFLEGAKLPVEVDGPLLAPRWFIDSREVLRHNNLLDLFTGQ
ncbi:AsmA family protein [Thiomicrospira cyclica]|uniref:AsmA family protein n=1 Tax=Thiomicrospira cyclica (strain DSM 14477 / JCM 11371 / ALM1) TaxID=717773 RepID=F6DB62_THICA|nr:AsmA family protein [Thiomicrospira cyclica]AEG30802.1 AsmA family protein [Thiomicrospira cyclica ALM1]